MYLQQKLNPTPPDPIQAKIFMFFPLFLTIILAPFPSGLVVYWTINNILTINTTMGNLQINDCQNKINVRRK